MRRKITVVHQDRILGTPRSPLRQHEQHTDRRDNCMNKHHTDRRDNCMNKQQHRSQRQLHENTQVRQDRQHRCKTNDMLLQHHAVTQAITQYTTCCSYSITGSHAWRHLQGTRADATLHSPANADTAAGMLTRPNRRTRDPRPLGDQNTYCPGTPSMPSHGRRRQEHPVTQSLRHCAWCFPVSGAAVQQAGGHGGRTRE